MPIPFVSHSEVVYGHISEACFPDVACNQWYRGIYNGFPYYSRTDNAYFVFNDGAGTSIISDSLGGIALFIRGGNDPLGVYDPVGYSFGNPIFSLGAH